MRVVVVTQFINHNVNSMRCIDFIDRHVQFSKDKIPLLGSASIESPVIFESVEYDYCGPTTDIPTKKMDHYPDIMCQKVTLCKNFTLLSYRQDRVKVVLKLSGFIHTEQKHSLWTRRRVRPPYVIH